MKEEDKEYSIIDDNPDLDWTPEELKQETKNIKKYKAGMRKALLNAQERSRKKEIKSLSKNISQFIFIFEHFLNLLLFKYSFIFLFLFNSRNSSKSKNDSQLKL
jgi:hypothetical protein